MYKTQNESFARRLGAAAAVLELPLVAVELPPGQEFRPEAVAAFGLAANLLSRIFTRVCLIAPDVAVRHHPWGVESIHQLRPVLVELSEGRVDVGTSSQPDIVLGIGAPPTAAARRATYVTFSGWRAGLEQSVELEQPGIFGALFAACYGSAQVFLTAARSAGSPHPRIKPFHISLLNYDDSAESAATPTEVDIGTVHLVGVGAVGSAFVYGLSHIPRLAGRAHLIDNDSVELSNLQRYALMRRTDVGRTKPDVAAEVLRSRGLDAAAHAVTFDEFADRWGRNIDLLLTPVDSEAGRRHLAASLPRSVLNAATGESTVTVSRHSFCDGKACLHCLYQPTRDETSTEERLAGELGLSVDEVNEHLVANRPVSADTIGRIEAHRQVEPGSLRDMEGKHLQSLVQRAICGEASIRIADQTLTSPLSFISATAGVLLAAELVKGRTATLSQFELDNYFRLDTLYAPNPSYRETRGPDPSRRCICWDNDFRTVYRQRYGHQTAGDR